MMNGVVPKKGSLDDLAMNHPREFVRKVTGGDKRRHRHETTDADPVPNEVPIKDSPETRDAYYPIDGVRHGDRDDKDNS